MAFTSLLLTGCSGVASVDKDSLPALDPATTASNVTADKTASTSPDVDQVEAADGFEVPDGWTVPPALSDSEIAANPLLRDMNPLGAEGPGSEYSIMIGVSRYRLVDEAGEPVPSGDAEFVDRTMTVWAFHGSAEPVVYRVGATRSLDHPEVGFSTTCDEALGFLFPADSGEGFRFSGQGDPGLYENRFFFGDPHCGTDDLSILPFLGQEFSIEVQENRSLRINDETDQVWLLEWVPIEP